MDRCKQHGKSIRLTDEDGNEILMCIECAAEILKNRQIKIKTLESIIQNLHNEIDGIEAENQRLQYEIKSISESKEILHNNSLKYLDMVRKFTAENNYLKNERDDLRIDYKESKQAAKRILEENELLHNQIERAKDICEKLSAGYDALSRKVRNFELINKYINNIRWY